MQKQGLLMTVPIGFLFVILVFLMVQNLIFFSVFTFKLVVFWALILQIFIKNISFLAEFASLKPVYCFVSILSSQILHY